MSEVTDETMVGCNIGYVDICNNTLIVSTSTSEYHFPRLGSVGVAVREVYKVHFYNL